ncbi:hypothetical protein LOTGIDRAFT_166628 [Lottia gigantea]|uniref:Uncharacterized protein n=1 Tax=Lottia gigantea TaxID=225164 RepID=V4A2F8_LOTGI|nr:hypothetical protein LOTGIDRAFT_166628 [Lottia gigantea]ESO87476.1 hypothetical protein LOTGIDRAFT_166628 [Lottia gigantea]
MDTTPAPSRATMLPNQTPKRARSSPTPSPADIDSVEREDESESEKRRGVPSLRERLPMSAGLGVGEPRARVGVWFGSVVPPDGAGVVSIFPIDIFYILHTVTCDNGEMVKFVILKQ